MRLLLRSSQRVLPSGLEEPCWHPLRHVDWLLRFFSLLLRRSPSRVPISELLTPLSVQFSPKRAAVYEHFFVFRKILLIFNFEIDVLLR